MSNGPDHPSSWIHQGGGRGERDFSFIPSAKATAPGGKSESLSNQLHISVCAHTHVHTHSPSSCDLGQPLLRSPQFILALLSCTLSLASAHHVAPTPADISPLPGTRASLTLEMAKKRNCALPQPRYRHGNFLQGQDHISFSATPRGPKSEREVLCPQRKRNCL